MGAQPSFVPTMMSRMGQKMSFIERTINFCIKMVSRAFMYYHTSIIDSILSNHLPDSPPSSELLSNLSGVLINSDFVLDYARPQPPTFINVGGLQIKDNSGQIPSSMLKFIEGAEHGVVLFTMGFIFDPTVSKSNSRMSNCVILVSSTFIDTKTNGCIQPFTSTCCDKTCQQLLD